MDTAPSNDNTYKTIPGRRECYIINVDGDLFSTLTNKHLKYFLHKSGYLQVNLTRDGKGYTQRLHRLLALAHIPNPDCLPCVNHIDGNKLNNKLENLEWCSYSHNIKHAYAMGLNKGSSQVGESHGNSRLTREDVSTIRRYYTDSDMTQLQIAELYHISREHCRDIINRKKWKHIK